MSRSDSSHHYGFSPLAGVTAGTAAILLCFGVLCLAWYRVAGQVSTGITVLVYAVLIVVCGIALLALAYAVLWVRHRARNPELLSGRRQVMDAETVPQAAACPYAICHHNHLEVAEPRAIEPPRVYFTDGQFAALMRQQVTVTQLPRDNQDREPGS